MPAFQFERSLTRKPHIKSDKGLGYNPRTPSFSCADSVAEFGPRADVDCTVFRFLAHFRSISLLATGQKTCNLLVTYYGQTKPDRFRIPGARKPTTSIDDGRREANSGMQRQ